jgi:hypothetical protein
MKNNFISSQKSRHVDAIKEFQSGASVNPQDTFQSHTHNGLADLQQSTVSLMEQKNRNWGFANTPFEVKRQKLDSDLWKITIENPKTHEIVLEAEGSSDKMFAYEDSLARMAEVLTEKGLKITTQI